ncbi:MAG TPA: PstS family phosphate ABC transporter substrate-binding protein [Coprothermobacter proteolyticus]|nr:PstS family phosphate ABC transporter substrate-binding protein [Coprothermobacter proteolyticus]HPZ45084.1 PstS family phosphate ABC transporter substrate-binding protein [Coprothermobacter proteolyticus]HQD07749.1 PstS family phosphate ABC transporter substrate-binding protein [Coprothermobacter proteolyticus]
MRRRYVSVVGFILVAALLLAGCTTQPENAGNTESKSIVIKGSDTEVNMVQALAEEFRNQHPDITISVSGGGSGSGIAALINGEIDIANSSREISQEELDQAKANNIEIGTFIDARDGITVIVHPNNPVEKLTLDQIGKIYRGEITNWKEVGGKDMPITLYGRQSNSGTFTFFRDVAVKGDYASSMRSMNGNSDIINAVAQDETAIGYVGVGYFKQAQNQVKQVLVSTDGNNYYSSTDLQAIDQKLYPLARPLYQYVKMPLTQAVKDFLAFEISEEGQAIVEENGFYPIGPEERAISEALLNK